MAERLNWSDCKRLVEGLELDLNEQVNVSHEGCEAGQDTKKRLYIKRQDNGHVLYCHHCGKSGWIAAPDVATYTPKNAIQFNGSNRRPQHYAVRRGIAGDVEYNQSAFPKQARQWLYRYITPREVEKYGIAYDPTSSRVYLPVVRDGDLVAYQLRTIGLDKIPSQKYITGVLRGTDPHYWTGSNRCGTGSGSTVCIITEDIISAIKVHEVTGYDSMALLRTTISDQALLDLAEYETVYIFLDDDNPDVRSKQITLRDKLNLLISKVIIIKSEGKDPKEFKRSDLKNLFKIT